MYMRPGLLEEHWWWCWLIIEAYMSSWMRFVGWKWNAAEVSSTRLVLVDTTHDLTFSPPPMFSPTDESLHEWLLDTLSDHQNETDYLICCALSDDRNRSNSFDTMICNGCFDAVMLSDSSFDSTSVCTNRDFISQTLCSLTLRIFVWDDYVCVKNSAIMWFIYIITHCVVIIT